MVAKNKMSLEAYRNENNRVHSAGKSGSIHKGDPESNFEQVYLTAAETLRNLQSLGGDLLCGSNLFDLHVEIFGESKADGANIYKGVEDALNKIAWWDDKQNVHFKAGKLCESDGRL